MQAKDFPIQYRIAKGGWMFFVALLFICIALQGNMPPQQQPKTVTITLSVDQAETVLKALAKLPYEESATVIQTVQQQAYKQLYPDPPKQDTAPAKKQSPTKKN